MTTKPARTNSKKGPKPTGKKLATIAPSFSPRQTDTIIAALRAYQEPGRCDVLAAVSEIASEHGDPLSNSEIDALVLQINFPLSCNLTVFEELVGLAELVAAGNTEIDHLERKANEVLARVGK